MLLTLLPHLGNTSIIMAQAIFFTILFCLVSIPSNAHVISSQEGHISAVIFNKGLDFAKDLLVKKAISSMIPLQIPDIEKSVKIPVIGKVFLGLSNITIDSVNISSSDVESGESGLRLVVSGATAGLSMNWRYSYKPWLVPVPISDKGSAFVQIEGMEVGVNLAFEEKEGTLELSLLDSGCSVEDISIELDGGASWLYQGLVDAFEGRIRSAVEDVVDKKIREGIKELDTRLQSLPKQLKFNGIAAMNVTFVDSPVLHESAVDLEVDGLFVGEDELSVSNHNYRGQPAAVSCDGQARMFGVALLEEVFSSIASLYFKGNFMHWIIDKAPNKSILNTDGWRYIVPELYEQYPDALMDMNISVTSPPVIHVLDHGIEATIYAEVTIDVLNIGEVLPVASILLEINALGSAEIWGKNFAGSIKLADFTAALKWSDIGSFNMNLLKPVLWTALETVLFPYVNLHLRRGLTLPIPDGYTLSNSEIIYLDSKVMVCTDAAFTEQYGLYKLSIHSNSQAL